MDGPVVFILSSLKNELGRGRLRPMGGPISMLDGSGRLIEQASRPLGRDHQLGLGLIQGGETQRSSVSITRTCGTSKLVSCPMSLNMPDASFLETH